MIALCARGADRNRRLMEEVESRTGTMVVFLDYSRTMEKVSSFKYLGCLLTETIRYWQADLSNIQKDRKI